MSEFDSLKRVSQELVAVVIATSGSNEPQILFKYPYKNCSERNDSYKCLEEFLKFEESTLCYLCLSQMNILHIELDNLTLIGRPTHLDVDDNQSSEGINLLNVVFVLKSNQPLYIVNELVEFSGILADAMAIAEYFDSYLSSVLLKFGFESPYQSLTRKSSCDVSFQGIYSSVSDTNLGVLIKNVYDGIIERSEVHVYVNNVSYISYIFHSDVVNMKQVVNGIKPYHALVLLFDSSKDALKCLPENHSPNVSKVLQCISSDKNLIYLAHDCGLSLQQLLSIAKHLVYWKIARVVYPIMRANRYSVNPDFPISRRDLLTFLHDKLLGELRDGTYSDKLYTRDNGNIIVHILSKIPTCGSVEALSPLTKDWPFILIIVTFLLRFNCIRQILLYPLFHSTGAEIDSPTGIKLSEIKQYLEGFHSVEHIAHILEVHRSDIISTMDEHKDSIFHFWRESQDLPDMRDYKWPI